MEPELGEWLLAQPETGSAAPGVGASDVKGHTHILAVPGEASLLWPRISAAISYFGDDLSPNS
ncbi:MAG: hypothetical protein CSB13_02565 [Chloroflexi bacterium]|nr:MAG: hypothetical protein CSB13_02565 [Chloroflexota bacterium]